MPDNNNLFEDLCAARTAAMKATIELEDGGTCCFDHPVIKLPKTPDVLNAIREAGFRSGDAYGIYKGWIALRDFPGSNCQGTPRTVGAETVAKVLHERGWTTGVYYAMD